MFKNFKIVKLRTLSKNEMQHFNDIIIGGA